MFSKIAKGVGQLFGSKTDKDVKGLQPWVEKINAVYVTLDKLSNDELRAKTDEFRDRIQDHLSEIDSEIESLKDQIEGKGADLVAEKEEWYAAIDKLEERRNEELEVILEQLIPEAFAVVKETAKRFTDNDSVIVTANDFDRDMAAVKENVKIIGNDAHYATTWDAAGAEVNWNMVHYDVQLMGGVVLHQGRIAEMATGEGKTLVSTLPAYLNALGKRGVHIVTVNDYLARRDCEWNGPIFEFHGISVDCIDYHRPNTAERRQAYKADITFGTNNEFGFDYLRDNMSHTPEELVQRKHHYAMIDEVDSVLIDDARTPLIISGPVPRGDQHEFAELKPRISKLVETQRKFLNSSLTQAKKLIADGKEKEGGLHLYRAYRGLPKSRPLIKFLGEPGMKQLLLKTEGFYLQDQQKQMHIIDEELYFSIDEKNNQVELTDKGIELISGGGEEEFFIIPDVGGMMADIEKSTLPEDDKLKKKDELMRDFSVKSERIHSVNQLLKAYTVFEKDVEYIIQDNKVKIVDEQTGRVMDGRRYSDGLHQAIEAKENVKVEAATQTFATITLQNYFRMYHKLAGMTGTAETEAGELWEIYELDVVVVPTNKPIVRDDREDLVYKTKREKYNAVIDEVIKYREQGRPILVGTTSVEVSETLSRMLNLRKLTHNVLNAKQHQREADIVAAAGQPGAVTIATNMAGRGTDIKLGQGVKEAGGLVIIGTERHDSRRVDRQLRGRAGRQGDPGGSQFFVSLEDNLMRLFGSDRVARIMDRIGFEEGEVIQHSMISKTIERSQKKVEQNHFGTRKRLLEYDDVMNKQREVVYSRRKHALYGERLSVDINNALYDWCEETVSNFHQDGDYEGLRMEYLRFLAFEPALTDEEFQQSKTPELIQLVFDQAVSHYNQKNKFIKEQSGPVLKQIHGERGSEVERILVPFTDGQKGVNVAVDLQKAVDSEGSELINSFERMVSLANIDENWKEHLRELDDLKQASNNASLEQKDPLLIYKLESFNLFKDMVSKLNTETLSLLFRGYIQNQDPSQVQEARSRKTDHSRMQTSRPDEVSGGARAEQQNAQAQERVQPVRTQKKVGRNDPCPCGSGKKYKKCHGKDA